MIQTKYRTVISDIPHPDSLGLVEELRRLEPKSMATDPPIVWERAEGFQVWDGFGNKFLDFTSAIILANAGHANPIVGAQIRNQLDSNLWHHYINPSKTRLEAVKAIASILPSYLDKVFLLSTGSEAVECAIKLMRIYGVGIRPDKFHIISYWNGFHGRTMASQAASGFPDQQTWMGELPPGFHHIPYPECARCHRGREKWDNCGADCFHQGIAELEQEGLDPDSAAGVIGETFQGPFVDFMPLDYVQALREWTRQHNALLTFDEIQAGFGRTGKWWGFLHHGVEPDLITMAKGMTGSLPMAAVAGRAAILDGPDVGGMSSTHSGNPLCCAAVIGNIRAIREGGLVENAARLGGVLKSEFEAMRERLNVIGTVTGNGLAWAVYLVDPQTGQVDTDLCKRVASLCIQRGLLIINTGRGTLKIAPPLCITEEALLEGIAVVKQAVRESV